MLLICEVFKGEVVVKAVLKLSHWLVAILIAIIFGTNEHIGHWLWLLICKFILHRCSLNIIGGYESFKLIDHVLNHVI